MPSSVFTSQYARFCELLVQQRQKQGMTQAHLAKRLGRPQSFVSKSERGERRLDLIEFLQIMHALRLDPCAFISQLTNSDDLPPNDS
ncbi:MAG: helix-turn-helix transcriptional regulator [Bacteroidetes bacterium]|nr:helix-turn-helix transcriptional regulator [Bacteroidota bacterium]